MSARRVLRAGGLWFDGKTAYARIPHSESLMPSGEVTMTFWVFVASIPLDYMTITTKWDGSISREVLVTGVTSGPKLYAIHRNTAGARIYIESAPINIGRWYFVAMRCDLKTLDLLVGTTKYSTAYSGTPYPNTGPLYIGQRGDSMYFLNGTIDDLRIYNRALSDDEIRAIYERGALIRDGLVLLLDFTEGEGSVAYDKSGCGNHATIYGARWVVKKALRVLQG